MAAYNPIMERYRIHANAAIYYLTYSGRLAHMCVREDSKVARTPPSGPRYLYAGLAKAADARAASCFSAQNCLPLNALYC